jgi:adenosine kinase
VDLAGTRVHDDLLTASCFITTDLDNNQITGFYPGAMGRAEQAKIGALPGGRPALAIVSPNDPGAMKAYPEECRRLGVPFLYDPGQQVIALDGPTLLEGVTGARALVVNDYELAIVQEKTGLALPGLLERCEAVVVTLGEHGSRIHPRGGDVVEVPIAPVPQVVDPTGAGDAYRGGLIKGMVSGADWETSGRLGALTASYCVESKGTSSYSFDRGAFAARYAQAFERTLPKGL